MVFVTIDWDLYLEMGWMVINFFGSILVTGVTRIWEHGKSRKVTVKSGGKNPKSTLSTKIRKKNPKSVLSTPILIFMHYV